MKAFFKLLFFWTTKENCAELVELGRARDTKGGLTVVKHDSGAGWQAY
jgi:hypothetical protein